MKTASPTQSPGPLGPSRRKPIHRGESPISKLETSNETVLTSPAKCIQVDSENQSYNETEENSTRIEEEEDVNNDDYGNGLMCDDSDDKEIRYSVEREQERQKDTKSLPKISASEGKKQHPKSPLKILLTIAVLATIVAISMARFVPRKETTVRQSCNKFFQLHSKYPNAEDMLWATLIVGVERAINDPGEPATFVFLYSSSSAGHSVLKDVIDITIECFGKKDAIWRTSNDFKSPEITQDYQQHLNKHREELKSQGVLVVRDLDQVAPKAAQVFFTICDSYEPLVRKAVIFFTIDISQRFNQSKINPTSAVEKMLKDLWRNQLHSNVLDPLVVRLTENVFQID